MSAAECFARPELLTILLRHVQAEFAQSEQTVACNALDSLTQRLPRWLLLTQDRTGEAVIGITQENLSIMLGVQRTTVTSCALALKQEGLIEYRRGQIRILDRKGLKRAACDCYLSTQMVANIEISIPGAQRPSLALGI
jgi:CRP-like cAMP-binding protein